MIIKLMEILEGKFRNRENQVHLIDVPMFSIFANKSLGAQRIGQLRNDLDNIKKECDIARTKIHAIGFPSMHANILISDLSEKVNKNTGKADVGGYAHYDGGYIELNTTYVKSSAIVHEWAHLWMRNNSKELKNAIKLLYVNLVKSSSKTLDSDNIKNFEKLENITEYLPAIKRWANIFEEIFFNKIYVNKLFISLIFKYTDLFPGILKIVPHGTVITTKLKKELLVRSMSDRKEEKLHVGDEVYVERGSTSWLIGISTRSARKETFISDERILFQHIDLDDVLFKFQRSILTNLNKIKKPHNIENGVIIEIKYTAIKAYEDICKIFHAEPIKKEQTIVSGWVKDYIFPKLVEVIKNPSNLSQCVNDPTVAYNLLWKDNKIKPSNVTATSVMTQIKRRVLIEKYKQDFAQGIMMVGPEYSSHRDVLKSLHDWVSSYGMSNEDELWATGIEYFFELPRPHKKAILKLMMGMGAT